MKNMCKVWMMAGIVLALGACSDSDDDAVIEADEDGTSVRASAGADEASVKVDAAEAQLALEELTVGVDTVVTGFSTANPTPVAPAPDGTAAPAPPASAQLDVACAGGGMASVDGYVNVVPLPVYVDVRVAIAYNACATPRGTTIAGNLEFSQTVQAAGAPLRVETLYTGDVELRGAVNARCPVDVNVLVDETGRAIQVSGTFCGHDASALNLQVMPRWSAGTGA